MNPTKDEQDQEMLSGMECVLVQKYFSDKNVLRELCKEKPVNEAMIKYVVASHFGTPEETQKLRVKFQHELAQAVKKKAEIEATKKVYYATYQILDKISA